MAFGFLRIFRGLNILPVTSSSASEKGDLEVDNTSGRLKYHNGTTLSNLITTDSTDTLTNKTIDADLNTVLDIANANIKTAAGIDLNKLAALNFNIVPITNGSGFITSSSVTATEVGYLSGVTSAIQTQLNGKVNDTGDAMTGPLLLANGSAAAPSLGFTNSSDSGLYRVSDNVTGVSSNGVLAASFGPTETNILGALVQGTSSNDWFNSSAISGVVQAYSTKLVAASNTNNTATALGAVVLEGSNNRRISMFVDDLNATTGLNIEASSGMPTFWLAINSEGAVNWNPAGHQTIINNREIRFSELSVNGSNYVGLKAPASVPSDFTLSLPDADGSSGQVLTTDGSGSLSFQNAPGARDESYELSNLGLSATVASNALTIALKTKAGIDPTANSPVRFGFRNSTTTNGTYDQLSVTSSLSLVISSGSTLGIAASTSTYLYVYAINNSGSVELAVSQILVDEGSLISTTAEGGAGGADSNRLIYSTTARSNVPVRLIGRLKVNLTTPGTWSTIPTETSIVPFDKGILIAKYVSNSGQSISNSTLTIVNFEDLSIDTNNTVTTGASWAFTAPKTAYYRVRAAVQFDNTTASSFTADMWVYVGGSRIALLASNTKETSVSYGVFLGGEALVLASETQSINVRVQHNAGSVYNLSANSDNNYIIITKEADYFS